MKSRLTKPKMLLPVRLAASESAQQLGYNSTCLSLYIPDPPPLPLVTEPVSGRCCCGIRFLSLRWAHVHVASCNMAAE